MLAFTADELEKRFRSDVNDVKTAADNSDFGCLWTDADVYAYMTVASDALAKDTQGAYRVLRLPVVAGVATLRLPPNVQHIRDAHLVGSNTRLTQIDFNDTWLGPSSGMPRSFCRDVIARQLLLLPTPAADDQLEIHVTVSISMPMEAGMPLMFTDAEDQHLVLTKMKALAYMKHDAETEDLTRARMYAGLYAQGALDRMSALGNLRRTPTVMRMAD